MTYRETALQTTDLAMAGAAVLLIVFLNALFFPLMKAPSALGRKLLDEISGFRMFLTIAEHERMKLADGPEMSEHLYASHLPYALAMDIELEWSDAFAKTVKSAIPSALDYDWYSDPNRTHYDMGLVGMVLALGAAAAEVLAAGDS